MGSLLLLILASCSVTRSTRAFPILSQPYRYPRHHQDFVLRPVIPVGSLLWNRQHLPGNHRVESQYKFYSSNFAVFCIALKPIQHEEDVFHNEGSDALEALDSLDHEKEEASSFDYTSFKKRIQENLNDELLYDGRESLPKGKPEGFVIIQQYHVPYNGFHNFSLTSPDINPDEVLRLKLESHNVTLPVALMMLDPVEYPSFSRARKACR